MPPSSNAARAQDPLKDILEYDKDRVVKQAEEREKELDKEVKLTAAEMLKLREKELEEQKKQQVRSAQSVAARTEADLATSQEKELADLADRRRCVAVNLFANCPSQAHPLTSRRELLEYKHALGLSHDHPRPPQRPPLTSRRPLSLHDDPEFWKLDDADRHRLELMHPDERVQYGFGPYEEDEIERECECAGYSR